MKKTLGVLFLAAVTVGSARGQAPASVAGYTFRDIYSEIPGLGTVRESVDLLVDRTFVTRFVLLTGVLVPTVSAYLPPMSGSYSYTTISASQATLTLNSIGHGPQAIALNFTNASQGTTFRSYMGGPFSITLTGGIVSGRALLNMSIMVSAKQGEPVAFGFVIGGMQDREILLRAVGPSLAQFGIANFAPNPGYVIPGLTDNSGVSYPLPGESQPNGSGAKTVNWSDSVASAETINSESARAGAFPLVQGSNDKADVFLIGPGAHTITVNPTDPTGEGVVLIEVYEVE